MRYAIIENEEFARLLLCGMIAEMRPEWTCVFTAESVEDTLEYLRGLKVQPDLIFMDIELDDGNCFDIFKNINIESPVVFTTAFKDFALQAFDVNSVGYLLKPITREKLTQMLCKIENLGRFLKSSPHNDSAIPLQDLRLPKQTASHGRILISHRDSYTFISSDEVAFFTAEDKCVSVTLKNGTSYLTDFSTLSECMEILDSNRFFHIARNMVANIESISKVTKFFKGRLNVEIRVGDTSQIVTVSSARKAEFLKWLGHSH